MQEKLKLKGVLALQLQALHYLELIGEVIIKHPTHCNVTLVKNVREVC